jgi:hypothetical protein
MFNTEFTRTLHLYELLYDNNKHIFWAEFGIDIFEIKFEIVIKIKLDNCVSVQLRNGATIEISYSVKWWLAGYEMAHTEQEKN